MATKIKVLISIIAGSLLLPAVSFAALGLGLNGSVRAGASASGTQVSAGVNFCTNLASFTSQVNARLATAQTNLDNRQQNIQTEFQTRENNRAQDLANLRGEQDQDRAAIYAKLSAKATTTAETQAVADFKATIEAAVTVRRSAVDSAIAAYWTGVHNIIQTRQTAVTTARQNYVAAIQAALSNAASQCSAGTAAATVRTSFAAAVKAANQKFATDRQAVDKAGPQIKVLAQTRNLAVQTAISNFKTAAEGARVKLKAAFSASASS